MDFSAIHVIVGLVPLVRNTQKKPSGVVYRHLFADNDILRFKTLKNNNNKKKIKIRF